MCASACLIATAALIRCLSLHIYLPLLVLLGLSPPSRNPAMPSFTTSTVVHHSTDTVHFELRARYVCVVGTPSDVVYAVKDCPPSLSGLDVFLQSDLTISLAGTLNGTRHEGRDMQTSVISQHLLAYFHAVCFTAFPPYVTVALILHPASAECYPASPSSACASLLEQRKSRSETILRNIPGSGGRSCEMCVRFPISKYVDAVLCIAVALPEARRPCRWGQRTWRSDCGARRSSSRLGHLAHPRICATF